MRRKWFVASWLAIAVGLIVVAGLAYRGGAKSAAAATQRFGPKEATVTTENGNIKAVHLTASKFNWQFRDDQQPTEVWGFNNQIPGPTLRFKPGDRVRVYFQNNLDEASSIHWSGLTVPNSMDGTDALVPPPVMPGETFVYEFTVPNTPGTFMYRASMDSALQVGNGLSGAFIVDPRDNTDAKYSQDRILLLNDIAGHYLINGKEFPDTDRWEVKTGDDVRVRMIDASATDGFPMQLHGHVMKEIARDGIAGTTGSAPVESTVWIAPGQTIDLEVQMNALGRGAWLLECQTLSFTTGPNSKSLNIALAKGGMMAPVVYTDSLNYDQIKALLDTLVTSIRPGGQASPTPTPKAASGAQGTPSAPATPQATATPQQGTPSAQTTPSAPAAQPTETPQAQGTPSPQATP